MKLNIPILWLLFALITSTIHFSSCISINKPDFTKRIEYDGNLKIEGSLMSGEKIKMYIDAISDNPLTYQWFKDNESIKGAVTDSLVIDSLTIEHEGVYMCVVSTDRQSIYSQHYILLVKENIQEAENNPPVWNQDTINLKIIAGSLITLSLKDSCNDEDNDSLSFDLIDGNPDSDSITIEDIYEFQSTQQDKGEYHVSIKASDGKVEVIGIIKICIYQKNKPPEFQDSLPKSLYEVKEGENLIIRFEAIDENIPADQKFILCNDSLFTNNSEIKYTLIENTLPRPEMVVFDTTNKNLTWTSRQGDQGTYKVVIEASDGKLTTEKVVHIVISQVNLPPRISILDVNPGDTLYITEKENYRFTAKISDINTDDRPTFTEPENVPEGATFDKKSGIFSFIPDYTVSTDSSNRIFHTITIHATDNAAENPLQTKFIFHIIVRDLKYYITAEADSGGIIDPSGKISVEPGQNYSFKITPNTQWKIKKVLINGKEKGAVNSHTFTDIQRDHTIKALFHEKNKTIVTSPCQESLPEPVLEYKSSEKVTVREKKFTRYKIPVKNWSDYPDSLFAASPDLPPCGLNKSASRTWVQIYDSTGKYIYGFCAFNSSDDLLKIWFSVREGSKPPEAVRIILKDRLCKKEYVSNYVFLKDE